MRGPKLAALVLTAGAIALGAGAAQASVLVYQNVPFKAPKGFPALGFECCEISEFGSQVEFAGVARESPTVKVWMMSYACEEEPCHTTKGKGFRWPITLRIYEVGESNEPGKLLEQLTRTFKIPYRPSPSAECPATPEGQGYGKECAFSVRDKISFKLPHAVLPAKAIIAVAFNTETYGEEPTGEPGPEDSLNVAVNDVEKCVKESPEGLCEEYSFEGQEPRVGSNPVPDQVYLNSKFGYASECEGEGAVGFFGLSGKCWPNEQPAFEVLAKYKY